MAKLRYDHIEFEGTPQELLSIFDGLKQRGIVTSSDSDVKTLIYNGIRYRASSPEKRRTTLEKITESQNLEARMPTEDQLVEYIVSKPRYEHDIVDVAKRFFGKQIKSREHQRLYRQLHQELVRARARIEIEKRGAFEQHSTSAKNLKVYSFRPVNAEVFELPSSQKS
jgi:hypothetical protein